jgi:mannosyltransferase
VGIATVPVVWAAARRLVGDRAALSSAGIVAVNPFLVWYSQEARPYALVVLLAAVSLYWWTRCRQEPSTRALVWWVVFSVLAIGTHYFAGFLIAGEAIWLLVGSRDRRVLTAVAAVAAGAACLAPLAAHQARTGHTDWITAMSLPSRLLAVPERFLVGETATRVHALLAATGLVALLIVIGLVVGSNRERRRAARVPLGLALASLGIPLLLALVGEDFIWPRNLVTALVPLAVLGGVALAAPRRGVLALLLAGALGLVSVAAVAAVDLRPRLQRADWRGVAHALGAAHDEPRAIVVPFIGDEPLEHYLPATTAFPTHATRRVREIVFIGWSPARYRHSGRLGRSFRLTSDRGEGLFELATVRARTPQPVTAALLAAHQLDGVRARALIQAPSP